MAKKKEKSNMLVINVRNICELSTSLVAVLAFVTRKVVFKGIFYDFIRRIINFVYFIRISNVISLTMIDLIHFLMILLSLNFITHRKKTC